MKKMFRSIALLGLLSGASVLAEQKAEACVNAFWGEDTCNCLSASWGGWSCYTNGRSCTLAGSDCGDGPGRSPL